MAKRISQVLDDLFDNSTWSMFLYEFFFAVTLTWGFRAITVAIARSEYGQMPSESPFHYNNNKIFCLLIVFNFLLTLCGDVFMYFGLLCNASEIHELFQRKFGRFLLGFEICFVVAHLIARGNLIGVASISGVCMIVVSSFKLVVREGFHFVGFFFLVNFALAATAIQLANDAGPMCEEARWALFPAIPVIAWLCFYLTMSPHYKTD